MNSVTNSNEHFNGSDAGDVLRMVLQYDAAGLAATPIRDDGSKAPVLGEWPHTRFTRQQLHQHFASGRYGIGLVCGPISGNLETLDFDHESDQIFPAWRCMIDDRDGELLDRLNVCQTPRGFHVRYRCSQATIDGNTKLAIAPDVDALTGELFLDDRGRVKTITLIETRGQGGQAIAPGTPAHCHPDKKTYQHHSGPPLTALGDVTPQQREILWECARAFNRWTDEPEVCEGDTTGPGTDPGEGLRPGDDYNLRGPGHAAIITPHGWQAIREANGKTFWKRPGKDKPGWSATTGFCKTKHGIDLLYVFSSNASPFEPQKAYTPFATFTLLNHGGDWKAAAKDLAGQGYGKRSSRATFNTKGGKKQEGLFTLGPLAIHPDRPRRTDGGTLKVPLRVVREGDVVDDFVLSSTDTAREKAARRIASHLPDNAGNLDAGKLISQLIVWASARQETQPDRRRSKVLEVVQALVPPLLQLTHKTAAGNLWSEARGAEIRREQFLAAIDVDLLNKVAAAMREPNVDPLALYPDAEMAMRVLWAGLLKDLPIETQAENNPETAAAQRFRSQLFLLWTMPRTWEKSRTDEGEVAARTSLAARARERFLKNKGVLTGRESWKEIQPAFPAWWRPHVQQDNQLVLYLGMRWDLAHAIGVSVSGVCHQESLTTLGQKYGCLDPSPPVSNRLAGEGIRLAVLNRGLTDELLDDPSQHEQTP